MPNIFDQLNRIGVLPNNTPPQQVPGVNLGGGWSANFAGVSRTPFPLHSLPTGARIGGAPKPYQPRSEPWSSGGGGGTSTPDEQYRNDISSGWDQYLGSLDEQLNSLSGSRSAQESTVNSQYGQGINDLNLQLGQGNQQLDTQVANTNTQQGKTLRDIGTNLANSFRAGNTILGARGAGDSSAVDQYSYALTKLGSQQRGDVQAQTADILNQINERRTNLTNIFNNEVKRLQSSRDQAINGIAQWFASAQQQIQQARAQGQFNKSQDIAALSRDILGQATSALSSIQQSTDSQLKAASSWYQNNAAGIQKLTQQAQQATQGLGSVPQAQPLLGNPVTDANSPFQRAVAPFGYGQTTQQKQAQQPFQLFQGDNYAPTWPFNR